MTAYSKTVSIFSLKTNICTSAGFTVILIRITPACYIFKRFHRYLNIFLCRKLYKLVLRLASPCFLLLFGGVEGCGYLFGWYDSAAGFAVIGGMYVLIYGFVWAASIWMGKADEKKINEAIDGIRDEE